MDDPVQQAIDLLRSVPRRELQSRGYHLEEWSFYTSLNDLPFLEANWDLWHDRPSPAAIEWDLDAQLAFVRRIAAHLGELADVPAQAPAGPPAYHWETTSGVTPTPLSTTGCCASSSLKRVVEVGSGWSSLLMARALERNELQGTPQVMVDLIEPYPRQELLSALPATWTLHETDSAAGAARAF